jgi:hypothetical protein
MTADRQNAPSVQEALAQMHASPSNKEIETELARGDDRT